MSLEPYSSRDVDITWGGVPIVGLATDGFVTITPNSDITDEEVGSDGQLQISLNADRTGTVVIQLQQNSPSNLDLSGILHKQLYEDRKFKRGALTVTDPSGSVIALLKGAYIKSRPEVTLSAVATGNTYSWTFFCEELVYTAAPPQIASALKDAAADRIASAVATLNGLSE